MIKTVGELVVALQEHPADLAVGVYDSTSEEGGLYVAGLQVQRREYEAEDHDLDGEDQNLYYKADSPFFYTEGVDEFLTIIGW